MRELTEPRERSHSAGHSPGIAGGCSAHGARGPAAEPPRWAQTQAQEPLAGQRGD